MLFQILVLLCAIPTGFLISWLARDELLAGKKWFVALMIVSLLLAIWFYLTKELVISLSLAFVFIVTLVSFVKSYDKKWTKN